MTGSPDDETVNMGPLATADQLSSVLDGVNKLKEVADVIHGNGERCDGVGAEAGKGYFFAPTILEARDEGGADVIHDLEVFALCRRFAGTTDPQPPGMLNSQGAGTLVTSVYSDLDDWVHDFLRRGGSYSGRFYLGSEKMPAGAGI